MGKIGNLAHNIGTSLNKEDINDQRQGVVPTIQTLKSLIQEERLTTQQNNQALLEANEVQRLEGIESGDGVWVHNADCCDIDVTGTPHGNENFIARGFTQERVNDIARNYPEKGYQHQGD